MTRGDSGILGKQFAMAYNEDLGGSVDYERAEISTTTLDSSIAVDQVMKYLNTLNKEVPLQESEVFADVFEDTASGHPCDNNGVLVGVPHEAEEVPGLLNPLQRKKRSTAGQCPKRFIDSCATLAYQTFVSVLLWVGLAITNTISAPVTTRLVTNAAVSHEEYMRRNPKWRKAILGPESDKWKIADDAERDQQLKRQPGKDGPHMVELLGGKSDVPKGMPIFPIKRVCKIKSNDIHLIYHFFLVWKTTQLMLWISHLSQRILLG